MKKRSKLLIILGVLIICILVFWGFGSINSKYDVDDLVSDTDSYISLGVRTKTDNKNIVIKDNNIYINQGGNYNIDGVLVNGTLFIDTKEDVTLNFSNTTIVNEIGSIIDNRKSAKVIINILKNKTFILSDGVNSSSVIKSLGDLVIKGLGNILIYGNNGNGITTSESLEINDVTLYVMASKDAFNVTKSFIINSGNVLGLGNNLLQPPSKLSKQNTFLFNFDNVTISEGINITLINDNNEEIISFRALRNFDTITLSSKKLKEGEYHLLKDIEHTGKLVNGIYINGNYTGGKRMHISFGDTFLINGKINWHGNINIMNSSTSEFEQYQ